MEALLCFVKLLSAQSWRFTKNERWMISADWVILRTLILLKTHKEAGLNLHNDDIMSSNASGGPPKRDKLLASLPQNMVLVKVVTQTPPRRCRCFGSRWKSIRRIFCQRQKKPSSCETRASGSKQPTLTFTSQHELSQAIQKAAKAVATSVQG